MTPQEQEEADRQYHELMEKARKLLTQYTGETRVWADDKPRILAALADPEIRQALKEAMKDQP